MKELLEAMESRVKGPFFGYFTLAFLAVNWKLIFNLVASEDDPVARIAYFDAHSSLSSLCWIPAIAATILTISYPWISFIFLYLCTRPTDLKNNLQAQSDHRFLVKRQELEKARAEILSVRETELIGRAKRDVELSKIEDISIKEKVRSEIDKLRAVKLKPDEEFDLSFSLASWDAVIRARIEALLQDEKTTLKELVPQQEWVYVPDGKRRQIGKLFKEMVDRGDFVGLTALPEKTSSNEQVYVKFR